MSNETWGTPKFLFDYYNAQYKFEIDAAASEHNKLCDIYFSRHDDALAQQWNKATWCNPPYTAKNKFNGSQGLLAWAIYAKAQSSLYNVPVVMCLPADTSTKYFEYCYVAADQIDFHARIKFVGASASAKFGTMIVIFDPSREPKSHADIGVLRLKNV